MFREIISLGHLLRNAFDKALYVMLKPFGPAFSDRKFSARLLLKQVIVQKVLRINGHVPWPVHWSSQVRCPKNIQRGTRCPGLSMCCYIEGCNGIIIGKNVWIGPKVSIISMNHDPNDYDQYLTAEPIRVGDNCWLGTGVIVLPGVRLGNHVVCAAGAVITRSFQEDNILLAGVPAKIVKRLQTCSRECPVKD